MRCECLNTDVPAACVLCINANRIHCTIIVCHTPTPARAGNKHTPITTTTACTRSRSRTRRCRHTHTHDWLHSIYSSFRATRLDNRRGHGRLASAAAAAVRRVSVSDTRKYNYSLPHTALHNGTTNTALAAINNASVRSSTNHSPNSPTRQCNVLFMVQSSCVYARVFALCVWVACIVCAK